VLDANMSLKHAGWQRSISASEVSVFVKIVVFKFFGQNTWLLEQ